MTPAPPSVGNSGKIAIGDGALSMRVVLDTNVLLSAQIRRNSVPGRVLEAWFDDHFVLLTHDQPARPGRR
jgi:hypothetical protein